MVGTPVTVVSGGSGGSIAGAIAARLARRGDRLVLFDADERRLNDAADAVGAVGGAAETHALDQGDRRAVEDVISGVIGRLGHVTYLFVAVADAGAPVRGPLGEMSSADWDRMVGSRLDVPFHVCRAVLPHMVERRYGAIVLGSSDPAVAEAGDRPGRAVARAALQALTKALALEFAAVGVRVNAVGSGAMEGSPPGPEDVASIVDFLLSDRASFITGQLLEPNGGRITW